MRLALKEAIWLLTTRHHPGAKPDIYVFATRRGGSTWLMELLAAEPGARYVNEPLGPWFGSSAQIMRMPKSFLHGHPVHFESEDEEARFREYFELVLSGRATVNAPWWFWRRGYTFRSDRLIVKILEAKALIGWFATNFPGQVVVFTRHPIPQALSCIRNGWDISALAYLDNWWFQEEHLGPELTAYGRSIMRSGSPLERFVLNWALENYVPLKLIADHPEWMFVSYEECVMTPEPALARIAARFDLAAVDSMRAALRQPSRSSKASRPETLEQIRTGEASAALRAWRRKVSEDEEAAALDILTRFGIPLYEPGRDMPRPWWSTAPEPVS